jgi:cytochrome c biogenesis protein CcmG/thiol:disulfide interchange protein DsbE
MVDEHLTGPPISEAVAAAGDPEPELVGLTPTPKRRRRRLLLPLVGGLVILAVLALFTLSLLKASNGRNLVSAIAAGDRPAAPEFRLALFWPPGGPPTEVRAAMSGGALDLGGLRGHPVLINFWASWCIPCRKEAPLLAAAAADHPKVIFIGVNVQDLRGDALGFLRRYRVPYAAVWDKTNSTYDDYGLTGVPETYFVNRSGRIVDHTPGPVTFGSLEAALSQIDH